MKGTNQIWRTLYIKVWIQNCHFLGNVSKDFDD